MMHQTILSVSNLNTTFHTPDGTVTAASDVSFQIAPGESVGVVGESGSGKTQVFLSIMGLLAKNGASTGSARYLDTEILNLPADQLNNIRGEKMSMIFQDPMTSLNPYLKISRQMTEVLITHKSLSESQARTKSIEMLERVGIQDASSRFNLYPHEFSGGMRQRVMIAMALLCEPHLLIADEPTTALDVTMQAQILDLLSDLKQDRNTAIIMITHDLGVVAGLCEKIMVMYAGRVVETGSAQDIFYRPHHPYTQGLLHSMPRLDEATADKLNTIPGQPPNLQNLPVGCPYQDRCEHAFERCRNEMPMLRPISKGHEFACHKEGL